MKIYILLFLAATLADSSAQNSTLFDVLSSTSELSTLATAIGLVNLQDYLTTTPALTLFAPTNDALQLLPDKYLTPPYVLHLQSILELHIVQGSPVTTSDNITDFAVFEAVNGETVIATVNDDGIFFSGDVFFGAQYIGPEIMASNGNILVVNQYFLPSLLDYDLYDLSTSLTGFDRIRRLITEAGLESELQQENRTILAPSDLAFDLLSDELVTQVDNNPGFRDDLLLYHIIIGCYPSSLITDGLEVMTALGSPLNFTVTDDGDVKRYIAVGPINQAALQAGDLISSTGIGHSLGSVLEVPVRSPPFVEQPNASPSAFPAAAPTTDGIAPTSESGETETPVELFSDAPVATPSAGNDEAPATSSASVLYTSLMLVLSCIAGLFV